IEEGVLLLTGAKKREMTVREAVEIIELVSRNPETIKGVLAAAEERGLIKREGKKVYISEGAGERSRPKIRRVDCDSTCRRCGVRIKNCFYIQIEDYQLGPYGSECVQKML
ncbi:MAG: hypothetical protein D6733_01050, partial [Methanobacteriota archaeon]